MNSSNEQLASILYDAEPSQSEFLKKTKLFRIKDIALLLEFPRNTLEKEKLLNLINYIHFINEKVLVHLQDTLDGSDYLAEAFPDPVFSDEVSCKWASSCSKINLQAYQFRHLILPKSNSIVAVPAVLKKMTADLITVKLPDQGIFLNRRRLSRFACQDLDVEIRQDALFLQGELRDFNSSAFRIRITAESYSSLSDLNFEKDIQATVRQGNKILFEGNCRILRAHLNEKDWDFIFRPTDQGPVSSAGETQMRGPRARVSPQPIAVFKHPFSGKIVEREVVDLSNRGFCLSESEEESLLIPGLMIPEMTIQSSGFSDISCKAQVVYKREDDGRFLYGISILDMNMGSYTNLNHLIDHTIDPHAFVSKGVNMDALWEFFFDTGFIYPKKYLSLQSCREEFKKTYQRLYQESPEIARHFIYKKNGSIYGHMSMVRAYETTWLVHHHAARPMGNVLPGPKVLKHVVAFLQGGYRLPSIPMDYVMCYYRPENEFPDRVFGGFSRDLKNSKGCSLDLFSYLKYSRPEIDTLLPESWRLEKISGTEIRQLRDFYDSLSGGMFLDTIMPARDESGEESLERASRRLGFTRKWTVYSLTYKGCLKAVFLVNQSDLGVNLSELLNSMTVFILDPEDLSKDLLFGAASHFGCMYRMREVPLLVYPADFLKKVDIPCDKLYYLWITDLRYSEKFMEFLDRNFRMRFR